MRDYLDALAHISHTSLLHKAAESMLAFASANPPGRTFSLRSEAIASWSHKYLLQEYRQKNPLTYSLPPYSGTTYRKFMHNMNQKIANAKHSVHYTC